MNWYKQAKLKEASIMGTIGRLLLVGMAHLAIIAFLMKNYNVSEEEAQGYLEEYQKTYQTHDTGQTVEEDDAVMEEAPVNQNTGGNQALEMIQRHEGFSNTSYPDAGGRSVGYGFYLNNPGSRERIEALGLNFDDVYSGRQALTREQANILLRDSVADAEAGARTFAPNFDQLPGDIQNVLTDMSYNLGNRLRGFRNMQQAVANEDWPTMAREMQNSDWYNQVGNRSRELVRIVNRQR